MNAPATPIVDPEGLYGNVVDALRPGCGARERRQRAGVLYLRDRASAARRVAGWEGTQLLSAIESIATVHALASMSPDELNELHKGLLRVMTAALAIDMCGPRAKGLG